MIARRLLLAVAFASLGGCNSDEARQESACRAFISIYPSWRRFEPPSEFRFFREPISYEQLEDRWYPGQHDETDTIELAIAKHGALEVGYVTGRSKDPRAALAPNIGCAFLFIDGELMRKDNLESWATGIADRADAVDLLDALGSKSSKIRKKSSELPCCIRP